MGDIKNGKVNLINRTVKSWLYNDGMKEPYKITEESKGTSVFANILFPVK
jgi:hypothetical protein